MRLKALPDVESLNDLFEYFPETGKLIRKKSGKEINVNSNEGYRRVIINGITYKAHRICWKMFYGSDPTQLDHIDGDGGSNRIVNLREACQSENMKNRKLGRNNETGTYGVSSKKGSNIWTARISVNDKVVYLGSFDAKEDAIKARKDAETKYGFHKNHGRKENE